MIFGVVAVVVGLALVAAPVAVARVASQVRFVPYSTDARRLTQYRVAGGALAAVGLVLALVLR